MKKYFIALFAIVVTFLSLSVVKADDKVQVYLLTKNGCGYCELAKENLAELKKEHPDLFNVNEIEVFDAKWQPTSVDMQNFWDAVYKHFSESIGEAGTPTFIIGDYAVAAALSKDDLLTQINAAKGKENMAEKIASEINVNLNQYVISSADAPKNNDALIIIGILALLAGGFAGLIYLSRK